MFQLLIWGELWLLRVLWEKPMSKPEQVDREVDYGNGLGAGLGAKT